MDNPPETYASGIHEINTCLIVPVGRTLDDDGLRALGREMLRHLETSTARFVLINMSAVTVLSSHGFAILKKTARSVAMMGGQAVFVGVRPGVAAALVELDLDANGILTAVTPADAFECLGLTSQTIGSKGGKENHGTGV